MAFTGYRLLFVPILSLVLMTAINLANNTAEAGVFTLPRQQTELGETVFLTFEIPDLTDKPIHRDDFRKRIVIRDGRHSGFGKEFSHVEAANIADWFLVIKQGHIAAYLISFDDGTGLRHTFSSEQQPYRLSLSDRDDPIDQIANSTPWLVQRLDGGYRGLHAGIALPQEAVALVAMASIGLLLCHFASRHHLTLGVSFRPSKRRIINDTPRRPDWNPAPAPAPTVKPAQTKTIVTRHRQRRLGHSLDSSKGMSDTATSRSWLDEPAPNWSISDEPLTASLPQTPNHHSKDDDNPLGLATEYRPRYPRRHSR